MGVSFFRPMHVRSGDVTLAGGYLSTNYLLIHDDEDNPKREYIEKFLPIEVPYKISNLELSLLCACTYQLLAQKDDPDVPILEVNNQILIRDVNEAIYSFANKFDQYLVQSGFTMNEMGLFTETFRNNYDLLQTVAMDFDNGFFDDKNSINVLFLSEGPGKHLDSEIRNFQRKQTLTTKTKFVFVRYGG